MMIFRRLFVMLVLLLGAALGATAQEAWADAFVTRWSCTKGEGDTYISIPINGAFDYAWVKASDGTVVQEGNHANLWSQLILEVPADGEYLLKAGPEGVTSIAMQNASEEVCQALLSVEKWGTVEWTTMKGAFWGCSNLTLAPGVGTPDLSQVTSMESMFRQCAKFNQPIGNWIVLKVTSMRAMFKDCELFNQPLDEWTVSRVNSMSSMFEGCTAFNQPLEAWDVSQVRYMGGMFKGCKSFDQPLEKWNVSRVISMGEILDGCIVFNQPLGGWTLSSLGGGGNVSGDGILGMDRCGMSEANSTATFEAWAAKMEKLTSDITIRGFGVPYNAQGNVAIWKLRKKLNWSFTGFLYAPAPVDVANAYITQWECQAGQEIVVPIFGRYSYQWERVDGTAVPVKGEALSSEAFPLRLQAPEAGVWRLVAGPKGVLYQMFDDDHAQSRNALCMVEQWGAVEWWTMAQAFKGCTHLTIAPGAGVPNLSWVSNMSRMFEGCTALNQPLEEWDVSNVRHMGSLFAGCSSFNQPLERWDVSNVQVMDRIFTRCAAFNQPLGKWSLLSLTLPEDTDKHSITLDGCGMDEAVYSATLAAWYSRVPASNLRVGASGLVYNTLGKTAREGLEAYGWKFVGDALAEYPTKVEILNPPAELSVNALYAFDAKVFPENAMRHLVWTVQGEGAEFNGNILSVTQAGEIKITVAVKAVPTVNQTITVTVKNMPLQQIALSPASAVLFEKDSVQLSVLYTPVDATNLKVTWISSDPRVAEVDEQGKVMALRVGETTITAVSEDGGHRAACRVLVRTALKGIAVTPSVLPLRVGETKGLESLPIPSKNTSTEVTWVSDHPAIATVDQNGQVTAVAIGKTKVWALSREGGFSDACEVIVYRPVKSITLDSAKLTLAQGMTHYLNAYFEPYNATFQRPVWSSSNDSIVSVDAGGMLKAVRVGAATITATSEEGGMQATCEVTVTERPQDSTQTESRMLLRAAINPNPFAGELVVRNAAQVQRYALVNAAGQTLRVGIHTGGDTLPLPTQDLPAGIYLLRLEAADGVRVMKAVRL